MTPSPSLDNSMLAGFLEEARGYLPVVESSLAALAGRMDDLSALAEVHRVAHTLRGSSMTFGLEEITTVAQNAEELADAVTNGDIPMDAEIIELFREAFAAISEAIERAAQPAQVKPPARRKSSQAVQEGSIRVEDVPAELVDGFLLEAAENLDMARESLDRFDEDRTERKHLKEARRGVHTIKGASGMVGLWDMHRLAKRLEDLLDELFEEEREWSEEIGRLIRDSHEFLYDLQRNRGRADDNLQSRYEVLVSAYEALSPEQPPDELEVGQMEAGQMLGGQSLPAEPPALLSNELLEGFLAEAAALLEGVDEMMASLESSSDRKHLVQEIRRRIHTVKGSSGMVGLSSLSRLAHRMEDLLDRLYEDKASYSESLLALLRNTNDAVADVIASGGETAPFHDRLDALHERYNEFAPNAEGVEEQDTQPALDAAEPEANPALPQPDANRFVRVPVDKLDELVRLVGELFVVRSAFDRQLTGYRQEVGELEFTLRRLQRIARQLEGDYAVFSPGVAGAGPVGSAAPVNASGKADRSEFDALEFDRYTQFHLLARDLTETASDIGAAKHLFSTLAADFDLSIGRQGRLTADIQDRLMRLRMVPLSTIAPRLQRAARVTAERTGKQVTLTLSGFEAEVDKANAEQLAAPLEHLLRNAIDHGIESKETRLAAGKPEQGSVYIEAEYEGTQVVIRFSDDGAGLMPSSIRAAAVHLGLVTAKEADGLKDEQLYEFLFQPGFTTAERITEISGRGIGLDIVKSTVEDLKGSVTVESEPGQWTSLTIRVPMSLSITKVLMIEANQETFALPLNSVVQVARVDYGNIETIAGRKVVRHERRLLPAVWLGEALALPRPPVPGARQSVVVIQSGGDRYALLVDRIVEARQVMVNPPSGLLSRSPALAGATIMGDGSVVLVLNPVEVVTPHRPIAAKPAKRSTRKAAPKKKAAFPTTLDVLVVDDSLSVRRVVSNLITKSGWNPIQAKDGLEALETLRTLPRKPDVILLDVEMPRMDGYEFAVAARALPSAEGIPIIMLTSRAGDKHRKKAFDAGVNGYLVKPYQDDQLLSIVREWVTRMPRSSS